MNFLSKILSGGASQFIDSVTRSVDELTLSKEEKQEFQLKMQEQLMKLDESARNTYSEELNNRTEIIKAEMAQGDKFTKRARPAIVYFGLVVIFIVHVIVPIVAYFNGNTNMLKDIVLPEPFWWAWTTVVGVYGVGRTAEKFGMVNKYTQAATGSGANKVKQQTDATYFTKTAVG